MSFSRSIGGLQSWSDLVPDPVEQHPGGGEVKTKQDQKDNSDINFIMARWLDNDVTHGMNPGDARYGDFSGTLDYYAAVTRVKAAERQFMLAPAHIREHVGHDLGRYLDVVGTPEGRAELEKLGLPEVLVPPGVPDAAVTADPPAASPAPEVAPEGASS